MKKKLGGNAQTKDKDLGLQKQYHKETQDKGVLQRVERMRTSLISVDGKLLRREEGPFHREGEWIRPRYEAGATFKVMISV